MHKLNNPGYVTYVNVTIAFYKKKFPKVSYAKSQFYESKGHRNEKMLARDFY